MSSKSDIDYKNTHFEFPEFTRIHGVPTTSNLITLQREVRANASTVHTTLGGGHHGHLGLACTPAVYSNVPNSQPYVRPVAPPRPRGATECNAIPNSAGSRCTCRKRTFISRSPCGGANTHPTDCGGIGCQVSESTT